jgi:hypothetical protein
MAMHRSRVWRSDFAIILLFSGLAVIFSLPVYAHLDYWGIQDWDMFLLRGSVSRTSVLQFGQFPLWNPYSLGGMPHLAQPETNVLSLPFLIELLFGVLIGNRINITLHLLIGLSGTYFLARHYQQGTLAATLAAFVFMFSGMYALTITAGMVSGYAIGYMPWALLFFLKANDEFAWVFAAVLVLTMMWLAGGVYPFCISFVFLGSYTLIGALVGELKWRRVGLVLVSIVALTFLLGAVKFLPAIEFTSRYPRHSEIDSGLSLEALHYGLFDRSQSIASTIDRSHVRGILHGFSHGLDEVGMYIGYLPFLLFLIGCIRGARKYLVMLLCVLVFAWLALGYRSEPLSLWALVHKIPPYSIMRTSERFRYVFMLGVALLAGAGLQSLSDLLRNRFPRRPWVNWIGGFIVALVLVDLFAVNSPVFRDAFYIPPIQVPANPTFTQVPGASDYDQNGVILNRLGDQVYKSFGASYPGFLANAGTIFAYESIPMPSKAVAVSSPLYRGEVYLEGASGRAAYRFWSPNRLLVEVASSAPDTLVINQNYYPGWRAKGGLRVEPYNGLIAVKIDPKVHEVEVYYRPTSFVIGALLSLATLMGMVFWSRYLRRRPFDLPGGKVSA